MNIDEYVRTYFSVYQEFAQTVRFILERALAGAVSLPRPQSV